MDGGTDALGMALFWGSAAYVLPFWILMILGPHWTMTQKAVASPWLGTVPPALCYVLIAALHARDLAAGDGFVSPAKLAAVMSNAWAANLFWTYAGAFDLFVGRWIHLDAKQRGISAFVVSPILFVGIFFGPIMLVLYWGACGVLGGDPKAQKRQ